MTCQTKTNDGTFQQICVAEKKKTRGLYYKHTMIVNYASSIINKLEALLTDDTRVIIYDRHVFIVQATGASVINLCGLIFKALH